MDADLVIYDALSITSKIHSPESFIDLLGIQGATWEQLRGAHGYRDRLYWNSISIHYNGTEEMGIWLEMMGQGCRAFETYGSGCYDDLFREVLDNPGEVRITRLDVAFDDHSGILDLQELANDARHGEFVSRFNEWQVIEGSKGSSVTHGSFSSEIFIRIYDKAAERHYSDGRHWIRVELQLRRDRALQFIKMGGSAGEMFTGVLLNYLRYVDPDPTDTNRWRWSLKYYWEDLCDAACKISLYTKPGDEYNKSNTEDFVYRQARGAIYTLLQLDGKEKFLDICGVLPPNLNKKYQRLLDDARRREVQGESGATQQNKNFVELEGGKKHINRPGSFLRGLHHVWLAGLLN